MISCPVGLRTRYSLMTGSSTVQSLRNCIPTSSLSSVESSSTRPSFAMVPILPNPESWGNPEATRPPTALRTSGRYNVLETMEHATLVQLGVRWLLRQCSVVLYEASQFPVCDPTIKRVRLDRLARETVRPMTTVCMPPRPGRREDPKIARWFEEDDSC